MRLELYYDDGMAPKGWNQKARLRGHQAGLTGLAWSPDGARIATGGRDGRLLTWDVTTRRALVERELRRAIRAIRWSPGGGAIALAAADEPPREPGEDEDVEYSTYGYEEELIDAFERDAPVREGVVPYKEAGEAVYVSLLDADSGLQFGSLTSKRKLGQINDLAWLDDTRLCAAAWTGVALWHAYDGHFLGFLEDSAEWEYTAVAASSNGSKVLATVSAGDRTRVEIWSTSSGRIAFVLESEAEEITTAQFHPASERLAVGSVDGTVEVWDPTDDDFERRTLEGHTAALTSVSFSHDGRLLATGSRDGSVRVWDTRSWTLLSELSERSMRDEVCLVAFSPVAHNLAVASDGGQTVRIWQLDLPTLQARKAPDGTVHYSNAKVVLLGDTGVGKTGLGLVLSQQGFRATESTHRRNVWVLSSDRREADTSERREVFLWDLAGQPGYRLLHQLHLSDVAVALVVFDARNDVDPLAGVRYWARALTQAERQTEAGGPRIRRVLVAARMDRGGAMVRDEDLREVRERFALTDYVTTSAKEGQGITTLRDTVEGLIDWDALPKISSTRLFDAIRAFLREKSESDVVLATEAELRDSFARTGAADPRAIEAEFRTCVERAQARGLVRRLSFGRLVLLKPEMLDAYAAAVLHEAASQPDGLGAVSENTILQGHFPIPSEDRIPDAQAERLLLIATVEDLLRHEIALREDSGKGTYLVFPAQARRTLSSRADLSPWAHFTFEGPLQHIWATLVVRLAHSGVFVQEEVGGASALFRGVGRLLGIRLTTVEEGQGQLELLTEASESDVEALFEGFVREHLRKRAVRDTVVHTRVVACPSCGFVVPKELLEALGPVDHLNCPRCPATIALEDRSVVSKPATSHLRVRRLQESADDERSRIAARTTVQGKEQLREFDAFLAHNSQDKDAVVALAERLRDLGLNPWVDHDEIAPGRWFQDVLQQAVSQVRSAVVFIGAHGLGRWEALELRAFVSQCIERGIPVIPVLLPGGHLPEDALFLRELQRVTFVTSIEEQEPFARLVWGITDNKAMYERLSK